MKFDGIIEKRKRRIVVELLCERLLKLKPYQ